MSSLSAAPPASIAPPADRAAALRALAAFADLHVVVLGDAILDACLEAGATRLAREAPVPNVSIAHRRLRGGGAANTAVNVASLGAQVRSIGVLGDDGDGRDLVQVLRAADVDTSGCVRAAGRHTRAKVRVVAGHQLLLSYDGGHTEPVHGDAEDALIAALRQALSDADVLIVADYGYGTVTARVQTRRDAILAATGARTALVTLDADGSVLLAPGHDPAHCPAAVGTHAAAAGAGDCFIGAAALALATGAARAVAHAIAQRAADLVVAKDGTACCTLAELLAALVPPAKLLPDAQALPQVAAACRRDGKRLVFTNGCFDLLHRGHVALLEEARAPGDVLMVAVNSDASARRLKGQQRPINRLEDRMQVLAALACVDHVIAFDADSAHALVRAARPQVFVKGGNWSADAMPEGALVRELGGEVRVLPTLWAESTSSLLQRIAARALATTAPGGVRSSGVGSA